MYQEKVKGGEETVETILQKARNSSKIPVYERTIENILSSILVTDNFWRIVELSEEPLPLVSEVIKTLREEGLISIGGGIGLTEEGRRFIEEHGIGGRESSICRYCEGRGLNLENDLDLLDRFKELVKDRPTPKHEFDQGFVTPETTISRVLLMHSKGDLYNKDVFVLGDDDLTSIALMLSDLPRRIVTVDIDERLIDFIRKAADEIGYNDIEVTTLDLREPLPGDYSKAFDTFITDPPETLYAIETFVGRGISSLRGERRAGYFGITRGESSLDKWREIQRLLVDRFNVIITDIIKNFNHYVNWGYEEETRAWMLSPIKKNPESIWYKSYMFRIETLDGSKGFKGAVDIGKELYDDEESSTT